MRPLDNQQRLHMVESEQLYRAWIEAYRQAMSYRYGMKWVSSKARQYLVRLHDARGNGKSLGPRNEETEAIFLAFSQGRDRAKARFQSLSEQMTRQARLNKATRLGRLPSIIGSVLMELDLAGCEKDFCVVGTHAIFAYESMAGVHCVAELLASGDVDLLYDPRKQLSLVSEKLNEAGLLGLLRRVDKSFEIISETRFRAANKNGFMVDLLIPTRDIRVADAVTFSEDDLCAVEVPNLHWLSNAPKCDTVVIAHNGQPVRMRCPDPRAFSLHKAWLSVQSDREPIKKQRDHDQAVMVAELILKHLPAYPFERTALKFLSEDMIRQATAELDPEVQLPKLSF